MSSKKRHFTNPTTSIADPKESKERIINGINLSDEPDPGKIISVTANEGKSGKAFELQYSNSKVVGNGSFGVVFQALLPNGDFAAVKKVLQDKRFKNRELQIMRLVSHPNIVGLKAYFYSNGDKKDEVFLNLLLEFVPETIYRASRNYSKQKQSMPMISIKLLDPALGILKLCDFGSAKILIQGEPNVSYICSRYYRAPELIFGSTTYNVAIDVWSSGCVMAELMLGQPIFPGESGVDQLVEIIKVLGTPTRDEIKSMNHDYTEYKFPQIKAAPWSKVFRSRNTTPESLDFLSKTLDYTPSSRPTSIEALTHTFFDELRLPETKLANGSALPDLFNFSAHELSIRPDLILKLVPPHFRNSLLASRGIDVHSFKPIEIPKVTSLD